MKCLTDVSTYLRKSFAKVVIISETAKFFAFFFVTLHPKHEVVWKSSKQNFPCQPPWYPCVRRIPNPNTPSSVVPMLTNNRKLAKTSSTPGKTLLINHFIINKEWYLVDLPGYGFAKRSKKEVDKLDQMIRGYILQREQLVNVFVLVDIRLEPQKIDLEFIEWLGLSSIPFAIIFTKADKLTPNKARQAMEAYKKKLLETWEELPPLFLTSSEKKDGRDDVLNYIEQINNSLK